MRRILLVLTAAMFMALLTIATAFPAFARQNCTEVAYTPDGQEICETVSGGSGGVGGGYDYGNGGYGGHFTSDPVITGQGGGGEAVPGDPSTAGGSGGRCVSNDPPVTSECVGSPGVRTP